MTRRTRIDIRLGLPDGYRAIALSIFHRAVLDVRAGNSHADDALTFLRSSRAMTLAQSLGIEQRLKNLVASLRKPTETDDTNNRKGTTKMDVSQLLQVQALTANKDRLASRRKQQATIDVAGLPHGQERTSDSQLIGALRFLQNQEQRRRLQAEHGKLKTLAVSLSQAKASLDVTANAHQQGATSYRMPTAGTVRKGQDKAIATLREAQGRMTEIEAALSSHSPRPPSDFWMRQAIAFRDGLTAKAKAMLVTKSLSDDELTAKLQQVIDAVLTQLLNGELDIADLQARFG